MELGGYCDKTIGQNKHVGEDRRDYETQNNDVVG